MSAGSEPNITLRGLAASDPASSAWVAANAGAGKTYLLTDRVTRLLLAGANPSRILCLTYTKAAAAEMTSRLFSRLGEWALLSDGDLRSALAGIGAGEPDAKRLRQARTLFAQALETPGGLKIRTIHSFCQHVLSRFPLEAGVPAGFHVLDERAARTLMAEARNTILERAVGGDAELANSIAILATRAADERFADILDFAIGDRATLNALLSRHGGAQPQLFAYLRASLGVEAGLDEMGVLKRFCDELLAERALLARIVEWLGAGSANDRKTADRLAAFLALHLAPEAFASLRAVFFTTENEPRKSLVTKPSVKANPPLAEALESLSQRVQEVERRRKAAATAVLTEALVGVSLAVLEEFDRLKRRHAALDYDDLTEAMLSLLQERYAASWVLYKLDGGLDHILVDEAQDTSPAQWKIVENLAEEFFAGAGTRELDRPRTLFAVGDEKQSIFSFQGADPAEFDRHRGVFKARAEGAGLAFADLRPALSRRSARAVLAFVDAVFERDAARDGLTAAGDLIHHDPHRTELGRVELWPAVPPPETADNDPWELPVDAPPRASAAATLAARIAERIAKWLRENTALPGHDRPIRPGDIMILVRRRNAFADEMIRQLLDRGVPVAGADRMVLLEQIAILDLVALGRFVLLPGDDLNLAALLKSPMANLAEDDLYDLAHDRAGHGLWEELQARHSERAVFAAAHQFLAAALAAGDFVPPFEFYARLLGQGLRRRMVAQLGSEAGDAIDEFLALALAYEGAHPPSLEGFLHWFEQGASDVKRDMDQAGGAVRVMTVHGAKGLEAEIVFLPDTAQAPDHERRSPLLYTEDCVYFGMPKAMETPPLAAAKEAARLAELREHRRLLYVAATRAREFLIVCGYQTKQGVHAESWYPHLEVAARRLGHIEEIDRENVLVYGAPLTPAAPGPPSADAAVSIAPDLPSFLFRMAPPEPPARTLRPSQAAATDEPALMSPLSSNEAGLQRGILVHALLAKLPALRRDARQSTASTYLARQGLDPAYAQSLIDETLAVLDDALFAPLFGAGSRAEVALTAQLPELGNLRLSAQIDRLAVTETSVLIADFKTNRPPPARLTDVSRVYIGQMALYRAALKSIYPDKRIDCALVWTLGPRLMALPEAILDAEFARITNRKPFPELG